MNHDQFDTILLNVIKSNRYRVMVDNVGAQVLIRNGRLIADVYEPVSESYDLSNITEFTATKRCIGCRLNNGEWHEIEFMKDVDLSELLN